MYKNGQTAQDIIAAQNDQGSWGYFHTLATGSGQKMSSENILRRLYALGFTTEDPVIQRAVNYLNNCLLKKQDIPDRREKSHPWDIFCDLMYAAWIRRFTKDNKAANRVAGQWAEVFTASFTHGAYSLEAQRMQFRKTFGEKMYGPRFEDPSNFYFIVLLVDMLPRDIEEAFIDYVLSHPKGIYYLGYETPLRQTPVEFGKKKSTRYLASIELILLYKTAKSKLIHLLNWLNTNAHSPAVWDFGAPAKDGIHLPLSDSWRKKDDRIADSTYWIKRILSQLN